MSSTLMCCYIHKVIYSMVLPISLQKGNTALHIACQLGFKHVVSILKSNNAKTDIKNHVSLPSHFIVVGIGVKF